jgi:hypothetical protein
MCIFLNNFVWFYMDDIVWFYCVHSVWGFFKNVVLIKFRKIWRLFCQLFCLFPPCPTPFFCLLFFQFLYFKYFCFLFLVLFFNVFSPSAYFWGVELNLELSCILEKFFTTELHFQPIFFILWDGVSQIWSGWAPICGFKWSSHLRFLGSWNYRCMPLYPA